MPTHSRARRAFLTGLLLSPALVPGAEPSGVDRLKTPDSPVLGLLGTSSPSIQRPGTPKAVAVLLANSLAESDGGLPRDFGMEVAPYWLTPRNHLTFSQYYEAGFIQRVKQSFAVSVVTSDPLPDSVLPILPGGLVAGMGMRVSLLRGRPDIGREKAALAEAGRQIQEELGKPEGPDSVRLGNLVEASREWAEKIGSPRHPGLNSDLAMAVTYRIPRDGVGDAELHRIGIWPSLSYVTPKLEAIAMCRYLYDRFPDSSHALDAGLRLVGKHRGAAFSLEAMLRLPGEEEWDPGDATRVVGVIEYQIVPGTYVSIGLGQDFQGAASGRLLALAGLSVGFGTDPVLGGR